MIIGFRTGEGALQTRTLRVTKDGRSATADIPVTGHGEEALTAADRTALATLDKPLGGSAPSSSVAMSADDLQSRRTWSYVAAGSGAAALIVGIALGANVQGQVNSARANTSLTNDQYASAIHSAQVTAGVADGFYGLAAVGIGLGGWLFYTSLSGSSDSAPAKSPEPDTTFSIAPTSGGGAFVLSGHF